MPAIVLVRPQLGENIGKAARAMLNFGLRDLRLVNPRDGWPNPAAGPAASGADIVLEKAQVFDTVAEAVADCPNVFATTVRKRGLVIPVATPEEAARQIRGTAERSAILFGAERSGLETEEVAIAGTIITVPVTHLASSEHRYATAPAMSSDSPILRSGNVDSSTFFAFSSCRYGSIIELLMVDGQMQLQRRPCCPYSTAMLLVNIITPALVAP